METDEEGVVSYLEREKMHEEMEGDISSLAADAPPLALENGGPADTTLSLLPPGDGGVEGEAWG